MAEDISDINENQASPSLDLPSQHQLSESQHSPISNTIAPLLLGTYTPRFEASGRFALPAKFRQQLAQGFVMARGQEHCVYILPNQEFHRMTAQIQRASLGNKAIRNYLRVFLSGAVDQQADKQGRVIVPPMLRQWANLEDDVVVIGVGTRAELWNKQAWERYLVAQEEEYADIADDVLPEVEW